MDDAKMERMSIIGIFLWFNGLIKIFSDVDTTLTCSGVENHLYGFETHIDR